MSDMLSGKQIESHLTSFVDVDIAFQKLFILSGFMYE